MSDQKNLLFDLTMDIAFSVCVVLDIISTQILPIYVPVRNPVSAMANKQFIKHDLT
jgi:hypothetical protein